MRAVVQRVLRADVTVGSFLSGGLLANYGWNTVLWLSFAPLAVAVGALAVAAALLYGISVVAQKLVLRTVDPLTATALGAGVGAIVLLPWAPRLFDELAATPISSTVGVLYLGLVPTALAFLLWAYALAHTSAGVAASSSYAVPALSILLSWIFLSETPTAWGLLGGALCLVGVAVSRIKPGSAGRRPGAAPSATAQPPAESARPTATPAGASC